MKKVEIVGGSGFVGTALARSLQLLQCSVSILDLNKSSSFPNIYNFFPCVFKVSNLG